MLFYRGTHVQGRRHLVTAAPSLRSCTYQLLCITIKLAVLPSSGDSFPHLIQKRGLQLGFVTHLLTFLLKIWPQYKSQLYLALEMLK